MGHLLHNIQVDENKNESKIKIEVELKMKSPPNKQKMQIGNKWGLKLFFPPS